MISQEDLLTVLKVARVAIEKHSVTVGDALDLSDEELSRLLNNLNDLLGEAK
jgi:hypothetical protein